MRVGVGVCVYQVGWAAKWEHAQKPQREREGYALRLHENLTGGQVGTRPKRPDDRTKSTKGYPLRLLENSTLQGVSRFTRKPDRAAKWGHCPKALTRNGTDREHEGYVSRFFPKTRLVQGTQGHVPNFVLF